MADSARIRLVRAGPARPAATPGRLRRNRGRRAIRWLHRTLGLFVALYVLMASVTGAALMFRHEILGAVHPELGEPPADTVARAEVLAGRLEPGSFTSIMFPDEALPAFIVYRPAHRTELFDPLTLAPIEDRFHANRILDWLFELHHFLLAGETGKILSGLFGIAIGALVLLGLYLWWPWRRAWRLRQVWPKQSTLSARLSAHAALAILIAPTLLLASVTGASVIFHAQVRPVLVALLGGGAGAVPVPRGRTGLAAAARSAFPDARPRIFVPPPAAGGVVTLRLRQPGESHPNGRSSLVFDPATGLASSAVSAPSTGAGNRTYDFLYPLHTGHAGGLAMRLALLLMGLATVAATLHGLGAWLARRRLRRRRRAA